MIHRLLPGFIGALVLLLLAACSSSRPPATATIQEQWPNAVDLSYRGASGVFPRPPELEPQIAFWRNVYGAWSLSQVALHDDRYMNTVYEVIDLPGGAYESYTPEQQDLIRSRKDAWKYRLQMVQSKLATGLTLDDDDKTLIAYITKSGGTNAVYGASERLRAQRGQRERFKRGLEISGRYDARFRDIFRRAGLPEDLAYLPHVESSFRNYARSSAGAVGVWQFTRSAAQRFMTVNAAMDERLDPVASAQGAARYLSYAHSLLGSWPLTVTSYNHGIGGMQRAMDYHGTDFVRIVNDYNNPQFGFASRNFYTEFLAARDIASQPQRYFPEGLRYEPPLGWERVVLKESMSVSTIARYYGVDRAELIALNSAWTDAADADRVPVPAGTGVWLPSGTLSHGVAQQ